MAREIKREREFGDHKDSKKSSAYKGETKMGDGNENKNSVNDKEGKQSGKEDNEF